MSIASCHQDVQVPRSGPRPGATAAHTLSVAPMMDRTDRHCRYFLRLLAPHAWLYTEMLTSAALLRGAPSRLLKFDPAEHPLALQLGGSDPAELAAAAALGADAGVDEINLNVGCPSSRVQAGCFGAALMLDPDRAGRCVAAMRRAAPVRITVKTRLGVDDHDDYGFLRGFVDAVVAAGCETLFVHARKAWLAGLSPKENRAVPPLDYERVYRLKADFPALEIVVNGGFVDAQTVLAQLARVDGVMLGRAAYQNPCLLAELDAALFGARARTPAEAVQAFLPYLAREVADGTPLRAMTRHLLGLYTGRPGGRRWRRSITELPEGELGVAALASLDGELAVSGPMSARRGDRYNAARSIDSLQRGECFG